MRHALDENTIRPLNELPAETKLPSGSSGNRETQLVDRNRQTNPS